MKVVEIYLKANRQYRQKQIYKKRLESKKRYSRDYIMSINQHQDHQKIKKGVKDKFKYKYCLNFLNLIKEKKQRAPFKSQFGEIQNVSRNKKIKNGRVVIVNQPNSESQYETNCIIKNNKISLLDKKLQLKRMEQRDLNSNQQKDLENLMRKLVIMQKYGKKRQHYKEKIYYNDIKIESQVNENMRQKLSGVKYMSQFYESILQYEKMLHNGHKISELNYNLLIQISLNLGQLSWSAYFISELQKQQLKIQRYILDQYIKMNFKKNIKQKMKIESESFMPIDYSCQLSQSKYNYDIFYNIDHILDNFENQQDGLDNFQFVFDREFDNESQISHMTDDYIFTSTQISNNDSKNQQNSNSHININNTQFIKLKLNTVDCDPIQPNQF